MSEETRTALKLLCPSLLDLATAIGVSHDTTRGWSAGRTDPSEANRRALAKFARKRAKELERLAAKLEAEPGQYPRMSE